MFFEADFPLKGLWSTPQRKREGLAHPPPVLGLELVAGADADDDGIRTNVVEHGLPFQTCGNIPVLGYLDVETASDVETGGPAADVIVIVRPAAG